MSELKKKFIAVFIPVIGLLLWSFIIMIKSLNTDETWRIIFSTIAFLGFLSLASLFTYTMIKRFKEEKK